MYRVSFSSSDIVNSELACMFGVNGNYVATWKKLWKFLLSLEKGSILPAEAYSAIKEVSIDIDQQYVWNNVILCNI